MVTVAALSVEVDFRGSLSPSVNDDESDYGSWTSSLEAYPGQVWTIWKDVSNNVRVFLLSDLLNKDNIRDARIVPFVKEWKPVTVKSYLGSLCLFLDFLMARKVVERTILLSVLATITGLKRSLWKIALQARTAQETHHLGRMFSLV